MEYTVTCGVVDSEEILGLIFTTCKRVFGDSFLSYQHFRIKHYDKTYRSYYCLVSTDSDIVATRCTMHLVSGGVEWFQHCETAVVLEHRRKGLFSKMTLDIMDYISSRHTNVSYINFPNNNSLPGYLRLGFKKESLFKGIVSPVISLDTNIEQIRRVKKESLIRRLNFYSYEVVSTSQPKLLALVLLLRGKILVSVGTKRQMFIWKKKINMVTYGKRIPLEFQPYWLDTISYSENALFPQFWE